jgi:UDP-N-acetylglucosamine acyltransferase
VIHHTSIVDDTVILGENVSIGPYSIVQGNCVIGDNTSIGPFCLIGSTPQDPSYNGERTSLVIGSNCNIRDKVIIESGISGNVIGNNCYFMTQSGIAHDTIVGDNVTFSLNAGTVGHCVVEDDVFFGMGSRAHQHTRIGKGSMIGAECFIKRDVLPYSLIQNQGGVYADGVNIVGMKRKNFSKKQIKELIGHYKRLFNKEVIFSEWVEELKKHCQETHIQDIITFVQSPSKRRYLTKGK